MRRAIRRSSASLEQLLEKDIADGTTLCRVLSAARAPGTTHEVAGLEAAMSAFAAATRETPRSPASHRAVATRTVTARRFALKALAAVSGVTLAGGVAYAATTAGFAGGSPNDVPPRHSTGPGQGTHSTNSFGGSLPLGPGSVGSPAGAHPRSTLTATVAVTHPNGRPEVTPPNRPESTRVHPTHPTSSPHPSPTPSSPASHTAPSDPGRSSHPGRPSHPPKPTPHALPS
jgi:hypothetical protein